MPKDKKLAHLDMGKGRVIHCFVLDETDSYYEVQIVEVKNPCSPKDWGMNEQVKISKSLIEEVKFK